MIPYAQNTHVQFEIRLLLFDSLELNYSKKEKKKEKKNTELINANQKPTKSDNLKYNKWLRKQAKNTGKTIFTRSVQQRRMQLKRAGMLRVSFRSVNFELRSHLGFLGKTQLYLAVKVSFRIVRRNIKKLSIVSSFYYSIHVIKN